MSPWKPLWIEYLLLLLVDMEMWSYNLVVLAEAKGFLPYFYFFFFYRLKIHLNLAALSNLVQTLDLGKTLG